MVPIVGAVHVDIIITLNSTIGVILLFVLVFTTTHSTPVSFPPILLYMLANINEFHEKSSKTGKNQPLPICQVSCTKANR